MERDDAVLTRTFRGVGDSAACALWEGFVRCVRVLPCEHESRSNVSSDMFTGHLLPTQAAHPPWKSAWGVSTCGQTKAILSEES